MRILVTGGAGFVGSHLVERLLEQGHQVVIADSFLTGRYANLLSLETNPNLAVVHIDLSQPLSDDSIEGDFDRVYNLASPASPKGYGMYPMETHLVNSSGVFALLSLARRTGARFLQASTSEVYGDPLVHPQPETYWGNVHSIGPRSCYDEGKRFAESLVMEFTRQYDLDTRIIRIFNTYGPRSHPEDGRVIPNFCVQALRGTPLTVYGEGTQTRSFCYVDDLVRGMMALMETEGLKGEVVNIGNPAEYTIRQLAEEIIALTNTRSRIVSKPLPVDDPIRRCPDITKARSLLQWQPEVDLQSGLQRTIDYFADLLIAAA